MSLEEKIAEDFKAAFKAGDKTRISMLRMVKSAMKNQEIDKKGPLTDDEISAILISFVKRAKESIAQFSDAGRSDLVEKENMEMAVLQQYLPEQLTEEGVKVIINEIIKELGTAGPKDMGKVMRALMAKAKGQIDGKLANKLVKESLEA